MAAPDAQGQSSSLRAAGGAFPTEKALEIWGDPGEAQTVFATTWHSIAWQMLSSQYVLAFIFIHLTFSQPLIHFCYCYLLFVYSGHKYLAIYMFCGLSPILWLVILLSNYNAIITTGENEQNVYILM